jgi:hypothetical protein
VLRKIFGPKRKEGTEGWRQLHNEELHYLYSSPNIITVMIARNGGASHVTVTGDKENVYRVLVGKPDGKDVTLKTYD